MCTFEPEKPEASVDRGARELPLSPGHDPSKTSSFFACNKRYVKCIKRWSDQSTYKILGGGRTFDGLHRRRLRTLAPLGQIPSFSLSFDKSELS